MSPSGETYSVYSTQWQMEIKSLFLKASLYTCYLLSLVALDSKLLGINCFVLKHLVKNYENNVQYAYQC